VPPSGEYAEPLHRPVFFEREVAMADAVRLPLAEPVALEGSREWIWVADRPSQSLKAFRAEDAGAVRSLQLSGPPVALAAANGLICAGLASGDIVAIEEDSGRELWRNVAFRGAMQLRSGGGLVWATEPDGGSLLAFDRSGPVARVPAQGLSAFAPANGRVLWLSKDGVLVACDLIGKTPKTEVMPQPFAAGATVCCANALWFSVTNGLLMVDLLSLQPRSVLTAPEGPVPHLICRDGKLAGGSSTVFILNPMTDMSVHVLGVRPQSPLRGIAATATKLWALESADPVVHIADFT
jgi:outer membrane protein assembly factor BamB